MRRFLAFIAVGLLLLSGRFYANGLSRYADYGDYMVFTNADAQTQYDGGLVRGYDRLELYDANSLEEILDGLGAVLLFTERAENVTIWYYDSSVLTKSVRVNGKRVKIAVAINQSGDVTVGAPIIKGSY